jgi:hypothetical protein
MSRNGFLPLKNRVRAREISELEEYLKVSKVRRSETETHSEMAAKEMSWFLRRKWVIRTKSK